MRWTRMGLATAGALLALAPAAHAATYTVTGFADGTGSCLGSTCTTLRAAVSAAGSPGGPHTISLRAGTYQLTDGQLLLSSSVTITGAGARDTSIAGNPNGFRVLEVAAGQTVSIRGVTLRDGLATDENSPTFYAGGVVLNHGTLRLDHVRVTGGHASSGGGIANLAGTLVVERSLIDNNFADFGGADSGGILNFNAGSVTVRNSTIAFNQAAPGKAGGYLSWGSPGNTALFEFVTLARNSGGGLNYSTGDTLQLRGSIVADNIGGNCFTFPTSLGGNVETNDDCQLEHSGVDNRVSELLQDFGGHTDVLEPDVESAAVDLIPAAQCPATDQRGVARPIGPACDAGAYEVGTPGVAITSPAPDTATEGTTIELRGTAGPSAPVTVFRNGASVAETTADVTGAWAVTVSLDLGEQTFEVETPDMPRASVRVVRILPVQPTPTPTVAPPTATPTPAPTVTPGPTPVVNRTIVAGEVRGTIKIKLRGSNRYLDLDASTGIPVGSTVDARKGRVAITTVPKAGAAAQTAIFYDGIFRVTQSKGITNLTLTEALAACPKKKSGKASAAQSKKKPKKRKLWGDGKGAFRTTGKYSAATVRGTKWLVEDSCAGTLTRVTQGSVNVQHGKKRIIVRAGKRYLAKPR